ncbi:MAG: cytochrome c1 [Rhodospirillaceae bacterium]|nr:cytochrome c1 [Rhodospirillaceae bacterium]
MKKIILAAAAALALSVPAVPSSLWAASEIKIPEEKWSFNGVLGKFDRAQVQRGYQVYKDVCAACHGLQYVAFRNLADLGYNEAQIKTLAAGYEVDDGPNEEGEMFKRKAKASDRLPKPFPNEQAARAANGGAFPPDLSLITKARAGGPDYIFHLMMGYEDPPADVQMMPGLNYNKYFPGHQIAMSKQISDGLVTYADGAPNDAASISKDVSAFLHWAAEPKLEARHSTGLRVLLYTLMFTIVAYLFKRRLWKNIPH